MLEPIALGQSLGRQQPVRFWSESSICSRSAPYRFNTTRTRRLEGSLRTPPHAKPPYLPSGGRLTYLVESPVHLARVCSVELNEPNE